MPHFLTLLIFLILSGCAELAPTPAQLHYADMQAAQTWIRGPLMEACPSLPGHDSQQACTIVSVSTVAKIRGTPFTHEDHFRIEMAKVKAMDEMRRLWTRTEQETWLRGPKTRACKQAPLATYVQDCLKSVQEDMDILSLPDIDNAQPAVRAERSARQIEANELDDVIHEQRGQETDLGQQQSEEPTLMVLGVGGELFGTSTATSYPEHLNQPGPQMPLTSLLPSPPVYCTSRHVGETIDTHCY